MLFDFVSGYEEVDSFGRRLWHSFYHTCTTCGKQYKWKGSLVQHIRHECGKEPHYFCNLCSYKTHFNSPLRRHLRTVHKIHLDKKRHPKPVSGRNKVLSGSDNTKETEKS